MTSVLTRAQIAALAALASNGKLYPSDISIATARALVRKGYAKLTANPPTPVYTITGKPAGYCVNWVLYPADPDDPS